MPDPTGATPDTATPGATPATPATAGSTSAQVHPPATGDQGLGEGGLAALERERAARRDAERELKTLREAAKAQQVQTQTVEQRIADLERRNAEYAQREQEAAITSAITAAATRLGFRDPEDAVAHVRAQVEVDEAGKPKNLDTLLKGLLQRKSYLGKAPADFGGGNRGTSPQGTDMNTLIRRAAGR